MAGGCIYVCHCHFHPWHFLNLYFNCNRFDVIPGLLSKVVTLPQEVVSKSIPCIGDSEILIDKKGMCVVPCAPKLSRTLRTSVIDLQVLIPDREKYEGKARVQVTRQIESIDPSKATIVCRKLRIGNPL